VDGIAFVVREDSPAQGEALAMATRQAMAKADSIAKSLNGRVVRIVETNEGGVPVRSGTSDSEFKYASNAAMNSNAAVRTPVQAGTIDVRSQVILVVDIEAKHG
jgi:uncharacterized protein YggE